ncbi:hypothetical protein MUY35_16530 [Aliiroseovarius sp. S1339]|uniref:hypothetical protein n=1 Tax=Aliiroseovarius sp. S1339 TaxID=2936990 RepID=UPI0020BF3056|nr:hypothetical protein [Aliiroseovarius sp. S1339]MCK8465467.1 hypothetical protein [Aliiroseovarius sp. S1339]
MTWAGYIYVALIAIVMLFQACMAAGAPWGHLANGGRWPGQLPVPMRFAAVGQGAILGLMGWAMAARAGIVGTLPVWTFWAALGVTVMTCVANLATPSRPERRIWGPVTVLLVLCGVRLAWS